MKEMQKNCSGLSGLGITETLEKRKNYHIMKQRRLGLEWQELIQECDSRGLSVKSVFEFKDGTEIEV